MKEFIDRDAVHNEPMDHVVVMGDLALRFTLSLSQRHSYASLRTSEHDWQLDRQCCGKLRLSRCNMAMCICYVSYLVSCRLALTNGGVAHFFVIAVGRVGV